MSYCKACQSEYRRASYLKNKDKEKINNATWALNNKDKIIEKNVRFAEQNPSWRSQYQQEYNSRRGRVDVNFKMVCLLRSRLNKAVKGRYKSGSAVSDLGCSVDELKLYLESKFLSGMTWDNWGKDGWHIDHVKPLVLFNLSDPDELKKACNYKNLQPLWAKDNLRKGAKYGQ